MKYELATVDVTFGHPEPLILPVQQCSDHDDDIWENDYGVRMTHKQFLAYYGPGTMDAICVANWRCVERANREGA